MVTFMEAIGWGTVVTIGAKLAYNLGCFVHSLFLGPALGRNLDPSLYGPWVVITGATDGIGKAYAKKAAASGLKVVLISRTSSKLQKVAEEIRTENGPSLVELKTIAVDFTEGQSIYPKLRKELSNLPIGMLINNVGMIPECGRFADVLNEDDLGALVNCNIMSMIRLTHMILPGMKERKRGLILNIGSLLGTGSSPMYTLYGASKAFVDKFSRDLGVEYRADGIVVQTVLPGLVATTMPGAGRKMDASLIAPTAEVFVDASWRSLGIEPRSAPYWVHKILLYIGETLHFFVPSISENLSFKAFSANAKSK